MPHNLSPLGSLLFAVAIVYVVYRRFRRTFGRQPLRPTRMGIRIGLLIVVSCLLAPAALRSAAFLAAMISGLGIGIALAAWGASRTRFSREGAQLYYLPHTYTGVAVSLLFLGRFAYRLILAYSGSPPSPVAAGRLGADQPFTSMVQSPLTLAMFFVLAGYYVYYYIAVLRRSKRAVLDAEPLAEAI
jgi:hypothetical protein